jgi:Zn-dependent protease with chaperone function
MKTTRTIIGVAIMSALLALYIVFAAYQAALLVASSQPLTLVYGLALFVAPVIGLWSLVRELVFGRQAGLLLNRYTAENGEPQVPVINRRDREAVDALLAAPIPNTWQAALIHGLTLDTVGRRREARAAVRVAITLGAIDSRS